MTVLENPVRGRTRGLLNRRLQLPPGCVDCQRALAVVVLCPSASEQGMSGWRCAREMWLKIRKGIQCVRMFTDAGKDGG